MLFFSGGLLFFFLLAFLLSAFIARFTHASGKASSSEEENLGQKKCSCSTTPPTPVFVAHSRTNHRPHESERNLKPEAAEIQDTLAARKRAKALLEDCKESQNTAHDKSQHAAYAAHVDEPVCLGNNCGVVAPHHAATPINISSPWADRAISKHKIQHITT